jgi:uncharacterized protein YcbK (DUF882 family)
MGNVSKNLNSWEVMPKDMAGKNWKIFIDEKVVDVFQFLRDRFGSITVNTWKSGGGSQYRGYRPADCGVGAKYSQHKFGRALDLVFNDVECAEVYDWIMNNQEECYSVGLRRVENAHLTKTWLHIDVMNHGQKGVIQSFNP